MGVPITYNLRNLAQRKGTTFMTALGIGLTVAVLVTALALTEGLRLLFAGSGNELQLMVLRKGADAELTSSLTSDAYQTIRQFPGIARTAAGDPMVSPEGLAVVNLPNIEDPTNLDGMNVSVRGILPIGVSMRDFAIKQGVMFEPGRRQAIVGASIAKRYPDAQIGKQIKFGRGEWDVVGIFASGDSAFNNEIWVDLNQLSGDFDRAGGSSSILVRAESSSALQALSKQIEADQRLNAGTIEEKKYYAGQTSAGEPLQVVGFSVAIIMAIGSAFAATNTMYAAVARRSREIGTLRALGFPRGAILRSFVLESVFLSLIGGIAGVLIALPINGLTTAVGNFNTFSDVTFHFRISPIAIAAGLGFAAAIGLIGGFIPAWSASRRDIIQAMREG